MIDDFLKHYGVLGMRWGKRKSRNISSDFSRATSLKKKHISELSDDELTTLTKRLNLEKNYKQLNPSKIKKGAKAVDGVLTTLGKITAGAAAITGAVKLGSSILNKVKG